MPRGSFGDVASIRALTINELTSAAALINSLIVRALRRLRVLQSLIIMMRRGAFLFSIITGFVEKSVNYL